MQLQTNVVTAFIGPSGCGKSTFLRTLNRMNDGIAGSRAVGQVLIEGEDIYGPDDVVALRRSVGMVLQKSNPVPEVDLRQCGAYGVRLNRLASGSGGARRFRRGERCAARRSGTR